MKASDVKPCTAGFICDEKGLGRVHRDTKWGLSTAANIKSKFSSLTHRLVLSLRLALLTIFSSSGMTPQLNHTHNV